MNYAELTPIRAAEAMREAAARAAGGDVDLLRRQGHHQAADAYQNAAHRILALAPESVLADIPPPAPDEIAAFEATAKNTHFNLSRCDDGRYMHPITERMLTVWRAAVRWARESEQPQ